MGAQWAPPTPTQGRAVFESAWENRPSGAAQVLVLPQVRWVTLGEALSFSGPLPPHSQDALASYSPEILGLSAAQLTHRAPGSEEGE